MQAIDWRNCPAIGSIAGDVRPSVVSYLRKEARTSVLSVPLMIQEKHSVSVTPTGSEELVQLGHVATCKAPRNMADHH